ncbi:MAG: response regulator [Candidatus Eremiobacteraeota bacterium]|nr:response regulator [Candidatus Eremiobacteraeota bacterium]
MKKKASKEEVKKDQRELTSRSFFPTTKKRIEAIKSALVMLEEGRSERSLIEELRFNYHKIAGSSGVYGFPQIGVISKKAENSLPSEDHGDMEVGGDLLSSLRAHTAEMEELLVQAVEDRYPAEEGEHLLQQSGGAGPQWQSFALAEHDDKKVTRPSRILIVDDDETIGELVEQYLTRAGYTIKVATDGKTALEEVFKFSPDMVILDIVLPDIDGMDVLKIIRQRPGGNILPIIFLTSKDTLEDRIEGLSIGGDDYITKPFYPEELVARVGALMARTKILKELAVKDGLTGAYNHRYFYERLIEEITRWKRYKRKFSLVIIDLDFFKNVNDSHGHIVGDLVLRQTADFLKSQLRNVDVVARYGGEEFGLILPETDLKDAHLVMRRIYDRMQSWTIAVPHGEEPLKITFSAGVTTCPDDGEDEKTLVARSDKALYYAKESGRNQFIIYRDLVKIMQRARDEGCEESSEVCRFGEGLVFVAEDDHLISNMLQLYLEKEGFRVKTFPNGAELLAFINLERPDLILLDVMMPIMDGIKALEIIKSQDDVKNVPVILLTSLDDSRILDRQQKLGAVDFVQKPFDPDMLVRTIKKYIK